ncbi:MAG: iron export ABC transporter permease subunit FetB [Burkholderiaceae bacterium]|jgi:putative ABC transport system permease protein|nr:iron export ABC transporter permease subunit FetB [Burkholderiaceae bacterium]
MTGSLAATEPAIGYWHLAIAATLLLANAALSLVLHLGLARSLLVGALRALVQLSLVGVVLKTVFSLNSPWLVTAVIIFMLASASREIHARQKRRLSGWWSLGIGSGVSTVALVITGMLALITLHPSPWWAPKVAIPMIGIVLGAVMNGVSLTLDALTTGVTRQRAAIEAQLALGATRFEALRELQRAALRTGTIPTINQMTAAGIITLPGMMTGQILAGMEPFEAAKYQILVLFLLAGGGTLGAVLVSYWVIHRVTDSRDRLRLDRLAPDSGSGRKG